MNKREYCQNRKSIAYYSGFGGLDIRGIEYGINAYIYFVSGCFNVSGVRHYHRCKIYYPISNKGSAFFLLYGKRVSLDECIRV